MAITTSANSTLTQEIVERVLVQPLAQRSQFLSMGVPVYVSDGNALKLPSLTSIGTAVSYVAEGAEIPEASVATSEVELLGSGIRSIKTLVKMTNESLEASVINLESAMAAAITTRVGALVDSALFAGSTATTGSPIGLANMTGVTSAGTAAGTALSSTHLFDMEEDYQSAFADDDQGVWVMSPVNFARVRKFSDNYGARVLAPSLADGAPSTILGKPYVVTAHVPDTSIHLIDRSQLAVGRGPARVDVLRETFADYDTTALRVVVRYDVKPLNPAAIVRLTIS